MPDDSNDKGSTARAYKADEVQRLGKYGLPVGADTHRMVERHFEVKANERAIAAVEIDHALRTLPGVIAALRRDGLVRETD